MAQGKTKANSANRSAESNGNGQSRAKAGTNGATQNDGVNVEDALLDEVSEDAANDVDETEGVSSLPDEGQEGATQSEAEAETSTGATASADQDIDPAETQEWIESLRYVLESKGSQRATYLLAK